MDPLEAIRGAQASRLVSEDGDEVEFERDGVGCRRRS
jgi:hypothetical protein